MGFDHRTQRDTQSSAGVKHSETMPGKRTLTEVLPVQRHEAVPGLATRMTAASPSTLLSNPAGGGTRPTLQMLFGAPRMATASAEDAAQVHAVAASGTTTPATRLPYADQIQRTFGRHDISKIQAHTGPEATASAREMGAEAYATGDHVVLGEGVDLHTAAHEAAHVVQQRCGVQLKGGIGETGDEHERHADEVADRVVRGESAEPLLDKYAPGGTPSRGVQRTIRHGDGEKDVLGTTWGWVERKAEPSVKKMAKKVLDDAAERIREQYGEVEMKRLKNEWGEIAKSEAWDDVLDLRNPEPLIARLVEKYNKSLTHAKHAKNRNNDAEAIAEKIIETGKERGENMKYAPSPRNPVVTKEKEDMEQFKSRGSSRAYETEEGRDRIQTQLATVIKGQLTEQRKEKARQQSEGQERKKAPQLPEEIQTALALDRSGVMVSGNKNKDNKDIARTFETIDDIERMTAEILTSKLDGMSRESAMADREVRHAMKLFDRLRYYLELGGVVRTPANVITVLDGRHAEIRINQDEDAKDYRTPTGTMYPCMGCKLYFAGQGIDTGVEMGELWLTNAALSTHVEAELKGQQKVGKLDDVENVATKLASKFKKLDEKVKMGLGVTKQGTLTNSHDADSDSELDDDDFERVKNDASTTKKTGEVTHTEAKESTKRKSKASNRRKGNEGANENV